jgi:hypothetical protein
MSHTYNCLSCGNSATQAEVGTSGAVAPCPQCGRDMYRAQQEISRSSGQGMSSGRRGGARTTTALPSRYGGGGGAISSRVDDDDYYEDDEDHNPALLKHTPLVVILGFIFSFLPIICVGGLIISIIGFRLVSDNPKGFRGKGLAIAGIALGSLMTLLTIVLIASS